MDPSPRVGRQTAQRLTGPGVGTIDNLLGTLRPSARAAIRRAASARAATCRLPVADAPPDLSALAGRLTGGDADQARACADTVRTRLHLPMDAFLRLMALRNRSEAGQDLTPAEWVEVRSILILAHKRHRFPVWRAEETKVRLDATTFVTTGPAVTRGGMAARTHPPRPAGRRRVSAAGGPGTPCDHRHPHIGRRRRARELWRRRSQSWPPTPKRWAPLAADPAARCCVWAGPGGRHELECVDQQARRRPGGPRSKDGDRCGRDNPKPRWRHHPRHVPAPRRNQRPDRERADRQRGRTTGRRTHPGPDPQSETATSGLASRREHPGPAAVVLAGPPAGVPRWRATPEDRETWRAALTSRCSPPVIDPDRLPVAGCAPHHPQHHQRGTEALGGTGDQLSTMEEWLGTARGQGRRRRHRRAAGRGLWTDDERDRVRSDLTARRTASSAARWCVSCCGAGDGAAPRLARSAQ